MVPRSRRGPIHDGHHDGGAPVTANAWDDYSAPTPAKAAHDHSTPVFGCIDCINADKDSWAQRLYAAWVKTYTPKRCCGKPMKVDGWTRNGDHVQVFVMCCQIKDGELLCYGNNDYTVELA